MLSTEHQNLNGVWAVARQGSGPAKMVVQLHTINVVILHCILQSKDTQREQDTEKIWGQVGVFGGRGEGATIRVVPDTKRAREQKLHRKGFMLSMPREKKKENHKTFIICPRKVYTEEIVGSIHSQPS